MRKYTSIAAVCALSLWAQAAYACEPCPQSLDLQQTMRGASLIIIGERTTPLQEEETKGLGGPEYVDITVHTVFKGASPANAIKATAWFSMCPYGMVTKPGEQHVMFLEQRQGETFYRVVKDGCSVKTLPVQDGKIIMQGQVLTPDIFKELFP